MNNTENETGERKLTDEARAKIAASLTKYRQCYCRQIIEYFSSYINDADDDLIEAEGTQKKAEGKKEKRQRRRGFPTYTKFAAKKNVTLRTLENWRRTFYEFDDACCECDSIQADILTEKGLTGEYQGMITRVLLSAKHNIVERTATSLQATATVTSNTTISSISPGDRQLIANLERRLRGDVDPGVCEGERPAENDG